MAIKWISCLLLLTVLGGCAWSSDYRDRKQPENYLEQTEPVFIP